MSLTSMIRELLKRVEQQDKLIADAVAAEREACIAAVLNEKVNAEATQMAEDAAYNSALDHAVAQIQCRDLGKQGGDKP